MERLSKKDRIPSLTALALIAALVAPGAWAKGETSTFSTYRQPTTAVYQTTYQTTSQHLTRNYRVADPIDIVIPECRPGEVLGSLCGPGPGPGSLDGTYPDTYEMPTAYDLFPADFTRTSLMRSYLLAFAAFSVYEPAYWGEGDTEKVAKYEPDPLLQDRIAEGGNHLKLEYYLSPYLLDYGIDRVRVFADEAEGAQAMVISTEEVVIVSFRGTQALDSEDGLADWDTNVKIFGKSWNGWGWVHKGDLEAFESIRNDVTDEVRDHVDAGKLLWMTGHSMGGGLATLAAMHFHDKDIPVEGVEVFGNPRSLSFGAALNYSLEGLGDRTARWQVEGDPIPTMPDHGVVCYWRYGHCTWITGGFNFQHVGRVHNVKPDKSSIMDFDGYDLDLDRADSELPVDSWYLYWGFLLEHAKYDDAILPALEEELLGAEGDALAEEWDVPSGDLFIEILPPLQLDPADRES